MVAATLRTIFAQPELVTAREAVERISRLFEKRYPKLVEVLTEAETDILGLLRLPRRASSSSLVDQLPGAAQEGGQSAL